MKIDDGRVWCGALHIYVYGSPAGEVSLTAGKPSSAKAKTRLIACGTTRCTLCSFLLYFFKLLYVGTLHMLYVVFPTIGSAAPVAQRWQGSPFAGGRFAQAPCMQAWWRKPSLPGLCWAAGLACLARPGMSWRVLAVDGGEYLDAACVHR